MKQGMALLILIIMSVSSWGRVDSEDAQFLGAMDQFITSIKQGDRYTHFKTTVSSFEKLQKGEWWKAGPSNQTIYKLSYHRTGGDLPLKSYYKCVTQMSQVVSVEGNGDIIIEEPSCTIQRAPGKSGHIVYDKIRKVDLANQIWDNNQAGLEK